MTARSILRLIRVAAIGSDRQHGTLFAGPNRIPCALGRAGTRQGKREGDGATPQGVFRPLAVLYRPDRLPRPTTHLAVTALRPDSGWCDDPAAAAYNQPVRLPFAAGHERLWRDDHVYDVIIVLDYNIAPVRKNAGSAIFLHLARDDFGPTAGCIAISPIAMLRLLPRLAPSTMISIG